MKHNFKTCLWISLTLIILVSDRGHAFTKDKTVTLFVENMTFSLCPITVKKALEEIKGVQEAVLSLKTQTSVVTFDEEAVRLQALIVATTNAGFPSTLMKEERLDDG